MTLIQRPWGSMVNQEGQVWDAIFLKGVLVVLLGASLDIYRQDPQGKFVKSPLNGTIIPHYSKASQQTMLKLSARQVGFLASSSKLISLDVTDPGLRFVEYHLEVGIASIEVVNNSLWQCIFLTDLEIRWLVKAKRNRQSGTCEIKRIRQVSRVHYNLDEPISVRTSSIRMRYQPQGVTQVTIKGMVKPEGVKRLLVKGLEFEYR